MHTKLNSSSLMHFVTSIQLLANYSHPKKNNEECTVAVNLLDTEKVVTSLL